MPRAAKSASSNRCGRDFEMPTASATAAVRLAHPATNTSAINSPAAR